MIDPVTLIALIGMFLLGWALGYAHGDREG
jgi:hypothetical protein